MSAGRILVVDDDPQIRRVMRVTLTAQGYEVDDARSGEEALEKLRERQCDLVLLDMNMPGMGGLETCRLIRADSEIAHHHADGARRRGRQGRGARRGRRRLRHQAVQHARAARAHPGGAAPLAVGAAQRRSGTWHSGPSKSTSMPDRSERATGRCA